MMVLGVWWPAGLVLTGYTIANFVHGIVALMVLVELPKRIGWWWSALRGLLACTVLTTLGTGLSTIKLRLLVQAISADEILWHLMWTMLAVRVCTLSLMVWAAAYMAWGRVQERVYPMAPPRLVPRQRMTA